MRYNYVTRVSNCARGDIANYSLALLGVTVKLFWISFALLDFKVHAANLVKYHLLCLLLVNPQGFVH